MSFSPSLQLPLDLGFPDELRFEGYYRSAGNAEALEAVSTLARAEAPVHSVYLWGPSGTGKTHLLVAAARQMADAGWSPYIDMVEFAAQMPAGEPSQWLAGLERASLVCFDRMESIAGDVRWEEAVFHCFNRLQAQGGRLLMAGRQAPAATSWALADWASRASWGLVLGLPPLQDRDRLGILQLRAAARGLELPTDVGEFLLQRYPRDIRQLNRILDDLDQAALAAARRLTIPFVRSVLRF